jgi:3-methyladenine DNA glycosylase AlkD
VNRNNRTQLIEKLDGIRPLNTRIRALAKEHGRDHPAALHLWKRGEFKSRMLSLLLLDLKAVDLPLVDSLIADIEQEADEKARSQLIDWLIANVLMKKAPLKNEAATWRTAPSIVRQRVFWSVQARSVRAENRALNEQLLGHIESDMAGAPRPVQWNMNWCAAQIGIADADLRGRCIALGERLGLFQDYPVPKGCTSPYLPLWINSVVGRKG